MQSIVCWVFILFLSYSSFAAEKSKMVSLTAEGGVSLVGPHCPGKIKLFCEGVKLSSLLWKYNTGREIAEIVEVDYDYTTTSSLNTNNPAFVSVIITKVKPDRQINETIIRQANFSSSLTVDLLQLNKQNVRNISCGDLSVKASQQVNVLDYFTPNVTVIYQFGILSKIEIQLQSLCSEWLSFKLNLTGNIQEIRCMNKSPCSAVYTNFASADIHDLKIVATNLSHTLTFNHFIAYKREAYFTWTINSTVCQQYTVQCIAAQNTSNQAKCGVRYTTEQDITLTVYPSPQISLPLKAKPGSVYNFEFFAVTNDHLLISESIKQAEPTPVDLKATVILSITSFFIVMSLLFFLLLFMVASRSPQILTYKKKTHIFFGVILFLLVFLCISLMLVFGILIENICISSWITHQNIVLIIMMVMASSGIVLMVIWAIITYKQKDFLQKTKTSIPRTMSDSERRSSYTINNECYCHQNQHSRGIEYDVLKFSAKEKEYTKLNKQTLQNRVNDYMQLNAGKRVNQHITNCTYSTCIYDHSIDSTSYVNSIGSQDCVVENKKSEAVPANEVSLQSKKVQEHSF